jgi:hypothetical protein
MLVLKQTKLNVFSVLDQNIPLRPHNKELYALYSLPSIIWVIKARRLGWAEHVACMLEKRGAQRMLVGRPEERRTLKDLDVDWSTILERI